MPKAKAKGSTARKRSRGSAPPSGSSESSEDCISESSEEAHSGQAKLVEGATRTRGPPPPHPVKNSSYTSRATARHPSFTDSSLFLGAADTAAGPWVVDVALYAWPNGHAFWRPCWLARSLAPWASCRRLLGLRCHTPGCRCLLWHLHHRHCQHRPRLRQRRTHLQVLPRVVCRPRPPRPEGAPLISCSTMSLRTLPCPVSLANRRCLHCLLSGHRAYALQVEHRLNVLFDSGLGMSFLGPTELC